MKIFHVINVRWFNATAWYALFLGKLMQDAGHDVLMLVLENTPPHKKALEWGLPMYCAKLNTNNPIEMAALYNTLHRLVKSFKPDVVNCHRGESFLLWGLLKKHTGLFKLIRTRGDQRPAKNNLPNRWLHKHVADSTIVTNGRNALHCRENLGVPPQKLWTILGGVDKNIFTFTQQGRERVRTELGFSENDFVVGLLGRFDEVKGQKELIQAISTLRNSSEGSRLRLLLIGHDSAIAQTEVESWIHNANIADITRITGHRKDVSACISALDLGVVASKWSEAIARAALEIMACNRPLISTNVGVMPDLLSPRALYAPAQNSDAELKAMLQKALGSPAFLEDILAEQQPRIARLGGQEFLKQTLSVYQCVLDT